LRPVVSDTVLVNARLPAVTSRTKVGLLRLLALLAGGSLLAASTILLSIAGDFPHPSQQAVPSVVTLFLGLGLVTIASRMSKAARWPTFLVLWTCMVVVVVLPVIRYVPSIYNFAYLHDVESLFPPLWPYSVGIPLLAALLGELSLSRRPRSGSVVLVAVSLVSASMVLFFGYEVVRTMASTLLGAVLPWRTFLAMGACIAFSTTIVLFTVAATRGVKLAGVTALMTVGLLLEVGSTFFYGPALSKPFNPGIPPISPWLAVVAGTVPGAMAILTGMAVILGWPSQQPASWERE